MHAELERQTSSTSIAAPAPISSLPLIARELELQRIGVAFDHAASGVGSALLLLGDAGIGKTRLAREAVREARARGFACAWGSGWPGGDAAPLWPWPSIVEQLGGTADLDRLIAAGDAERFSQFRAVAGAVEAAASNRPVLVVLDDAHTTDLGALLLARFVTRATSASSVVFLFTAREHSGTHADRERALDDIAGDAVVLRPSPLRRAALGDLLRTIGRPVGPDQLTELHELTGGNPLLIHELAVAAPGLHETTVSSMRSVLDRRLDHFDAGQRDVLTAAAVLGPFATAPIISLALGRGPDRAARVAAGLASGEAAGVVTEGPDGVVVFAHHLLAEALLAALAPDAAADLRGRAAAALELDRSPSGAERWAAIARHRLAAIGAGPDAARLDPDDPRLAAAAAACSFAADRLVAEFAYETASALLAQAVELHDRSATATPTALVLQLADAELAAGRLRAARPWFRRAAEEATDPVVLAQAAVGLGGIWVFEHRRTIDHAAFMALLDRALAGLAADGVDRPDLVARLRVRRAAERVYAGRGTNAELTTEVSAALALGDANVSASSLSLLHHTMLGPAHAHDRLAVADEMVAVAAAAGGDLHALLGVMWRTIDLVLTGSPSAERSVSELAERADALQVAAISFVARAMEVMRMVRAGLIDEAEAAAEACFAFGSEIGDADALGYFGAHLVFIRWLQCREAEILPLARDVGKSPDLFEGDATFPAALGVLTAAVGAHEEARIALRRVLVQRPEASEVSSNWLLWMFCATETAAALDERDTLAALYDAVAPYADLPVMCSLGVLCLGSAQRILGIAAQGIGRLDVAVDHFVAALAHNRRLANRPMAAITEGDLGCALVERGRAGDTAAGLGHVADACSALELLGLHRRATLLRDRAARVSQQVPPVGELIRCGTVWRIVHGAVRVEVADSIGIQRLALLLQRPHVDVPAAELVGSVSESARQPLLDTAALRAYRDRVEELRGDIDEAEADADLARAERLRDELDTLLEHLGASAGLGGRSRAFAGGGERARVAVRKSLRRVFDEIAAGAPDLGAQLQASVRTGTTCRFEPVAGFATTWRTLDDQA